MNCQILIKELDFTYSIYLANDAYWPYVYYCEYPGAWSVAEQFDTDASVKIYTRLHTVRTVQCADSLAADLSAGATYNEWLADRIITQVEPLPYKPFLRECPYEGWKANPYRIAAFWDGDYTKPYECWVRCGYTYKCIGAFGESEWSWENLRATHLPTGSLLPAVKTYAQLRAIADLLDKVEYPWTFGRQADDSIKGQLRDIYLTVVPELYQLNEQGRIAHV